MGKKECHSGPSPKDRAINLMDKFITRNANRAKDKPAPPGLRKDKDIPLHLWPLKDQIEYWETRSNTDKFNDTYSAYSTWYDVVKTKSGVYPTTFMDFTSKLKPMMVEMWENKVSPKLALEELRKHGVY